MGQFYYYDGHYIPDTDQGLNLPSRITLLFSKKPAGQAAGQTLPDAAPTVGKIHPFSKIAVTVGPIQRFRCPSRFRIFDKW